MSTIFTLLILFGIVYFFFGRKKEGVIGTAGTKAPEKKIIPIIFPQHFWFSLGLILLGWNVFLYDTWPWIGFTAFSYVAVAALLLSFDVTRRTLFVWSLAAVACLAATGAGLRASGFVGGVDLVAVVLSIGALVFLRATSLFEARLLWLSKQFFTFLGESFQHLLNLFQQHKIAGKEKTWNVGSLIKTLGITVIVIIFFVGLLSAADPVFAKIIEDFREQIIGRAIVTLIVALVAAVVLSLRFKPDKNDELRFGFLSYQDLLIPTIAVVSLFAVFLFVQAQYLFGDHESLKAFNLTYSEYVRKGFTELLVVTFFGGLLSYLVMLKNREVADFSRVKTLLSANAVLIVELGLMLLSAFKRDLMYVETYGLTRVRIIGGIFLLWLATFLVLLFVLNLRKAIAERTLLTGMYIASICVVVFLNVVNVDQLIVDAKPSHHDYKDYFYINNLSADAIAGWRESVPEIEQQFVQLKMRGNTLSDVELSQLSGLKLALISLQEKRRELEEKYYPDVRQVITTYYPEKLTAHDRLQNDTVRNGSQYVETHYDDTYREQFDFLKRQRSWQAWNWSEANAYNEMQNNRSLYFTQVDRLVNEIKDFQRTRRVDLYTQEYRLLREFSYPFMSVDLRYYPQHMDDLDREVRPRTSPSPRPYNIKY